MTTTTAVPVLQFPAGIPGLADATEFILESLGGSDADDSLFEVLRSTDDTVSLIVTQPWSLFPDYAPDLPDDELAEIGIHDPQDVTMFCSVTLDQAEGCVFVNLLGPFVVNVRSRVGRQVILSDAEWPLRARVDIDQVGAN